MLRRSGISSQYNSRIKLHGFADRADTSCKGDQQGGADYHSQHHWLNVDGGPENGLSDAMRQHGSGEKTKQAACECEQSGLGEEKGSHGGVAGAQRLHQSDFIATL